MIMPLEDNSVSLKFNGIKTELGLKKDSDDSEMLDTIAQGLRYVSRLEVGDPIPTELSSGRASWDVSDRDRAIANNRVTMQLVSWMSGDEMVFTDAEQLMQIAQDPATRDKINTAFGEAAVALGLGEDKKSEVISLVGNLAEELSYIEALRNKFHMVEDIHEKILTLEGKYKSELSVMDTITPVKRLFLIALDGFSNSFEQVDAQTGEILAVLKNIAQQTKFIRDTRDDLRSRLWAWEGQFKIWELTAARRSHEAEEKLDDLYRFLAQRYLPVQEWELFSQAQDKKSKQSSEKVW